MRITAGVLLLLMSLLLGVLSAEAQLMPKGLTPKAGTNSSQQSATPARNTVATADTAAHTTIPLPQTANRAEQLDRLLREFSHGLTSDPEIREVQQKTEVIERLPDRAPLTVSSAYKTSTSGRQ
ncbi:MAG: hypothetical protein C5B55_02205 [Blastocatellia bacterium]|nr:MAG: hypothetical protein C5B55_02205 [Blastocatellia bacterium]